MKKMYFKKQSKQAFNGKKRGILFFLLMVAVCAQVFAQDAFTVTWPLTANNAANKVGDAAEDVTANTAVIGAQYAYQDFSANGLTFREGTSATPGWWLKRASSSLNNTYTGPNSGPTTTMYLEFAVTASNGKDLKINNINIPITRLNGTGTLKYYIIYSLDDYASVPTYIAGTSPSTPISNTADVNFSYTNEIIVPQGKTLSVRFIIWRSSDNITSSSTDVRLKDVKIEGTSTAAVPVAEITWIPSLGKYEGAPVSTIPAPTSENTSPFVYSSSNADVATISGDQLTIAGAGTSIITATQVADGNYQPTTKTTTLTVYAFPTAQASELTAVESTPGTININWRKDNAGYGNNSIVILYKADAIPTAPVNGTAYTTQATNNTFAVSPTGNIGAGENTGYIVSRTNAKNGSQTITNVPGGTYDIYIYQYNGSGSNGGEAYLTSAPLKVTVTSTATLPVSLTNFSGKLQGNHVALNWATASEKNNSHFDVLRSVDGKTFSKVGEVQGNGTSAIAHKYNYTDKSPAKGNNYYQLNQVDFDGKPEASEVIVVKAFDVQGLQVYQQGSTVSVLVNNAVAGVGTLTVADISGKVTSSRKIDLTTGNNQFDVDLGTAPKGVYLVKVLSAGKTLSAKFIR